MWALLMAVLMLLTVMGIFYLSGRIRKFYFVKKLVKGRKGAGMLAGLLVSAVLALVLKLLLGTMNAIICILHLVIFWMISDAVFCVIQKMGSKTFRRYYAGVAAVFFTVCYLGAGWYMAHHVWRTEYRIRTDKEVGNLRVAVLSDSHTGTTFHGDGFARHLKEIEAQNPDILLIAGDYVDDYTSKEDMISCCKALGGMKTTYGVYYVFGNHDKGYYPPDYRGYDSSDLVNELEKNGVHVMQDDVELVDGRFYIIGRQDKQEEYHGGRKTMKELTEDLDQDIYSIVLDHQPQDYAAQAEAGVDLVLSGHTHGGQLFPLMIIENLIDITADDRVYGHERRGNTDFIVTSGISDWAIKFKTGCKSEYLIVEVRGK